MLWLADAVEVFFVQVQGSARVTLPDGREVRLAYDGRNGQPYTSIGRLLIEAGEIPEREMSLARLKAWLRANGLEPGDRGRALMQRNAPMSSSGSKRTSTLRRGRSAAPGFALTPLRSIAVDRSLWAYGLPFWIDAELPWEGEAASPFRRLMIAQDTGSAIVGAARADIFFGGGDAAGARAGAIRHRGAIHGAAAHRGRAVKEAADRPRAVAPAAAQRRRDRAVDRGRQERRASGAARACRRSPRRAAARAACAGRGARRRAAAPRPPQAVGPAAARAAGAPPEARSRARARAPSTARSTCTA